MAHNQYLSFKEYQSYGGTAPDAEFPLLEFRARKRIDYLTDSRVQKMEAVPESVKLCAASLMNIDYAVGTEAQIKNPVVTSFNNDGYSESYGKAPGMEDAENAMTRTIKSMLWGETDDDGVPLLYRGVFL